MLKNFLRFFEKIFRGEIMSDNKIMLAVPVSGSFKDNMELNLYCDLKKGDYDYLGLYKDKSRRW